MPPTPSPTHFLCIPLAGPQLSRSLAAFRADVTGATSPGVLPVPEDAVRPPGTMHLTLGVMSLRDGGVARAVEVLRGLRPREVLVRVRASRVEALGTAAGGGTSGAVGDSAETGGDARLSVTLQGLHSMQPAARATVLYAPPSDPEGILHRFCSEIKKAFQEAELFPDDERPLLLHATVVNTIYVKGRGGGSGRQRRGGGREKLTIDAQDILSRYDGHVWLEGMPLERMAICRMGAKAVEGEEGDARYEVEAEIEF